MKLQLTHPVIVLCLVVSLTSYSQAPVYPFAHPKGYVCYTTESPISIDGLLTEEVWQKAQWTDLFTDISGENNLCPYLDTKVKMLWDNDFFYIAADLEEPHLWGTITERDKVIFKDNDFEVFIDPDGDNHHYYELEMNVLNTVWDLLITKPYRNGGNAIDNFNFIGLETAVSVEGSIDEPNDIDEKWTVEIAIPWHNFEEWNQGHTPKVPQDGEQWRINFSRVQWELDPTEYSYTKKLDFRRNELPENNWVWSAQGVVQMHQPETWGYVQFSEQPVGSSKVDFRQDLDFNLKMALMEVYFQQKKYFNKHSRYTENLDELQISEYNEMRFSKKIKIETMSNKFIVMAEGYNGLWQVDECSKITLTSKKIE